MDLYIVSISGNSPNKLKKCNSTQNIHLQEYSQIPSFFPTIFH